MWFLAALNSFLLLAISFDTEISFPERESHPIILEMSSFSNMIENQDGEVG